MAYQLKEVTIRAMNSEEGLKAINEIWQDITSGRLPLIFDSEHEFKSGISPVSKYSHYALDGTEEYDLTIMAVTSDFFKHMEESVSKNLYKKFEETDDKGDISNCTKRAWEKVWTEQQEGSLRRAFTDDYESAVPAEYTKDGKAHCYLYISISDATE